MSRTKSLIVEDDDDLRHLFRVAFSLSGFDVTEARTGAEALEQIGSNPPDVVVLDLDLPLFRGELVREQIDANMRTRDVPIVVVTGSTEDLDGLGVARVLRKPVSAAQLIRTVESCLPGRVASSTTSTAVAGGVGAHARRGGVPVCWICIEVAATSAIGPAFDDSSAARNTAATAHGAAGD